MHRKGKERMPQITQIPADSSAKRKKGCRRFSQIHPVLLQAKKPARICAYFLSVEILMLLSRRPGMSVGAICATGLYRSDPSFVLEEIKG